MTRLEFADVVFLNAVQLVTDLANDVTFMLKAGDAAIFNAFVEFFNINAQFVLDTLYRDGVVTIAHTQVGEGRFAAHKFYVPQATEYTVIPTTRGYKIRSNVPDVEMYALVSPTFEQINQSDRAAVMPWLVFINNVINSSNTVSARLGSLVVATPSTPSGAAAPVTLQDWERKEIEKEITDNYGSLAEQSQFLLFGQDMKLQTINLAGLDQRTLDKFKMAVLVIADRLKIPANQIATVDAMSSKSFANGTEMREGDFRKYQTFERLLNRTFVRFANDLGLQVDYTIYNKPERIEQNETDKTDTTV